MFQRPLQTVNPFSEFIIVADIVVAINSWNSTDTKQQDITPNAFSTNNLFIVLKHTSGLVCSWCMHLFSIVETVKVTEYV